MSLRLTRARFLRAAAAAGASAVPLSAEARGEELIEVTDSETATIDGRDWDTPIMGGRTVDAVHRSVLLRFPDAADTIAILLRKGKLLLKAELSLQYDGYEIVPTGYTCREGLGRKLWTENPPTWHVHAWPLRQPWIADKATGPTFNASVNGRRYWARYGATDLERDRHADLVAPQELSVTAREARFDITRLLATDVLAREAGARLLMLEQCGFLLRKVETYDSRYRQADAYEWAMPTGGHGLQLHQPAPGADLPADHGHGRRHHAAAARPQGVAHRRRLAADRRDVHAARDRRARDAGAGAQPAGTARLAARLAARAHPRAAQGGRRPGQQLVQRRRRRRLQGLPGPAARGAGNAAALLAGLEHRRRASGLVHLPRPAAGAGAGSCEELLAGLAAARPRDQRLPPSAEPRRHRLLQAQPGLARPRLVLPRRLQLRDQHPGLQSYRPHGRASGRRHDRRRLAHGRRPTRAGDAAPALLVISGRHRAGDARPLLPVDHAQRAEDVRRLRAGADRAADGPHPGRPHHGDACQRPSSQAAPLRLLVGAGAHQRRAGRAGRHLWRRACLVQEGHGELPRQARERDGRRHAGVGLRLPARARGDPEPAFAVGARLGGGPDRRQAGAVRGDLDRDHPRQLQAAAVATRLARRLAWPGQHRHPRPHRRRRGPMGARAQGGDGPGRSRHAHGALCRERTGSHDDTRRHGLRGRPHAHLPEPQPRHHLRQAAHQPRQAFGNAGRARRDAAGDRRRSMELLAAEDVDAVCRRQEDRGLPASPEGRPAHPRSRTA